MKNKKRIVIPILLLLLILTVPVPAGQYKDGGTRDYKALAYRIVAWNRLIGEGETYRGTKVYPFPQNLKSIDELWAMTYDRNASHSIRYALGSTADHFSDMPTQAKAGEVVEIKTNGILYDGDIHVYVDGMEIEKSHYDSDYWAYSFVMPDNDALVTAKFYSKSEIWGTAANESELREKYPAYFDLPTAKGLEVYVWQMAPGSYSFGLMEGTNREKTPEELWNMKGATAEEMRAILASYDIEENDVFVIPWQNPISSYIGEYWFTDENEDADAAAARRQAYIDAVREMLFPSGSVNEQETK